MDVRDIKGLFGKGKASRLSDGVVSRDFARLGYSMALDRLDGVGPLIHVAGC